MEDKTKHRVYFTDCKKGIERLDDQSIDLVVSGPPYFDHITYSEQEENMSTKGYSDFLENIAELWSILKPKMKDGGILALWLHDIYIRKNDYYILKPFHSDLIKTLPNKIHLRHIVTWDRYLKKTYKDLPQDDQLGTRMQYVLIFSKGKTKYEEQLKRFYWNPIWYFKTHPRFLGSKTLYRLVFYIGKIPFLYKILNPLFSKTKKGLLNDKYRFDKYKTTCPPEVAQMLINKFSKKGDVVCDPFLGSGTTLGACEKLGRNCVGFEINKQARNVILEKINEKKVETVDF